MLWGEPYDPNDEYPDKQTDRFWNRLGFVRNEEASVGGPVGYYVYGHVFTPSA